MKIRTNATLAEIQACADQARVGFSRFNETGARGFARTVDVILTGSSARRSGSVEGARAATWTEWGDFLGYLFVKDPDAIPSAYKGGMAHFEWATYGSFPGGTTPEQSACSHRWETADVVTRTYAVRECSKCLLMHRWTSDWSLIDPAHRRAS